MYKPQDYPKLDELEEFYVGSPPNGNHTEEQQRKNQVFHTLRYKLDAAHYHLERMKDYLSGSVQDSAPMGIPRAEFSAFLNACYSAQEALLQEINELYGFGLSLGEVRRKAVLKEAEDQSKSVPEEICEEICDNDFWTDLRYYRKITTHRLVPVGNVEIPQNNINIPEKPEDDPEIPIEDKMVNLLEELVNRIERYQSELYQDRENFS